MNLTDTRVFLEELLGEDLEALIDQPVILRGVPGASRRRALFVGLAPDERGDWCAVLRSHEGVLDLYIVHPSQLSRVPPP